jgi:polyisoprenoid-binding protein YceI
MKTVQPFVRKQTIGAAKALSFATVFAVGWLSPGALRAQSAYSAKSGKIAFSVSSNIPLVTVTGSSSILNGGGEATVADDTATIRNLRFEVDPVSFKTGIRMRDEHLYERVFTASDGSRPKIVLRAERFQAKLDPKTSKWGGTLQAQLTIRGVTRPVSFHAIAEKKGEGAQITADGVVKTSEFGVKPISYSGAKVHDEVNVTVSNLAVTP